MAFEVPMQESIFRKITGDPDFDPSLIFEDALVEFIKNHPERVAKDRVALKWLVRDPTIINRISSAVNINDTELIPVVFDTIEKMSYEYARLSAREALIAGLKDALPEKVEELIEIIKEKAPETRLGSYPEEFIDKMAPEQRDSLVEAAVGRGVEGWGAEDWRIASRTEAGFDMFMDVLKLRKFVADSQMTNLVSRCARVAKLPEHKEILLGVFSGLNSYVCFACSRGVGAVDNDIIKSLSGYTLHREKCDPQNEFPSPHEIITGKPKTISFVCNRCGDVFTTASGLTLHRKACR